MCRRSNNVRGRSSCRLARGADSLGPDRGQGQGGPAQRCSASYPPETVPAEKADAGERTTEQEQPEVQLYQVTRPCVCTMRPWSTSASKNSGPRERVMVARLL